MQNSERVPGKRKRSRGTTKNSSRLDAFANRNGAGAADWGGCNPERLQGVVVAITALGGAVTFGLSRDQGAHSLTLMLDGQRETMWFNGGADLDAALDDVLGMLDAMQ
jgi:hypothetical protein